jgi:hypothetical protein
MLQRRSAADAATCKGQDGIKGAEVQDRGVQGQRGAKAEGCRDRRWEQKRTAFKIAGRGRCVEGEGEGVYVGKSTIRDEIPEPPSPKRNFLTREAKLAECTHRACIVTTRRAVGRIEEKEGERKREGRRWIDGGGGGYGS